jgi:serine/threonine protein kinase
MPAMSTPSPSDWAQVRDWFERAQPLDAAAREALLAGAGLSPAMLAEVRSLLAHGDPTTEGSGSDFLSHPAVPERLAEPGREGQLLGPWRIVARLGTGGMGNVWLAERADGAYAGQAAIKVLKRGMDTATVLERFAQEQQALARMAHPHIAHLLDAGQTDDGLPYFVMERVVGQPIDTACAGLPLAARLGLFLQLADAVAHAHRKLLVHRDLKPSNVLVTAEQQVKLLDFGIAKALDPLDDPMDQRLDGGITLAGERPFTPLYASPEQIRGEAVGTATDIYSLGVLLYVMLTGVRPYGRQATSAREAARSVLEEQPSRPSALSPEQVADPNWLALRQRLKGDLDNILLKALAKDIDTRYVSVDALADDVRAYLGGYPVSAQPPRAAYLLAKFVQRNRWPVAAATAAVLALVGGLAGTAWQAHRAEQRLAQLRDVTRDVVLRYGDAVTFLPGGLVVKEDLLKTLLTNLDRLEQEAGDDPEWLGLLAGAYARLAQIQGDDTGASLDKMPDARTNAQRAIDLALRAEAARLADPALVANHALALQMRAQGLRAQGKPEEGLKDLDDALARLDRALAAAPTAATAAPVSASAPGASGATTRAAARRALRLQHASVELVRAQFHDQQTVASLNQPEKALALYEQAAQALRQLDTEQADPEVAALLGTLHGARAITHARMNRLDLSQSDADLAFRQRLRSVQAEPFNTAWRDGLVNDATNAAVILLRADRPAPALEASQAAWTEVQALARESGPQSKWISALPRVAQHHGRALVANGRYAEALPVLQTALVFWDQSRTQKPGPHPNRMHAWLTIYLARALQGAGDPTLARQRLAESVAVLTPLAAQPKGRDAQLNLGEACLLLADLEPAQRATWRQRALQAYTAAQALLPLTGDHLRNYTALGGKT